MSNRLTLFIPKQYSNHFWGTAYGVADFRSNECSIKPGTANIVPEIRQGTLIKGR